MAGRPKNALIQMKAREIRSIYCPLLRGATILQRYSLKNVSYTEQSWDDHATVILLFKVGRREWIVDHSSWLHITYLHYLWVIIGTVDLLHLSIHAVAVLATEQFFIRQQSEPY